MWNDKESLKTAILQIRDLIKNVKNLGASHEAMKKQLKELEDIYRYHYEGGNRPSHLPASLNNTWVGCHKCEWERQLDDNENKNSFIDNCGNCHKQVLMFYPSNERKIRTSADFWVDSSKETLGGGGGGENPSSSNGKSYVLWIVLVVILVIVVILVVYFLTRKKEKRDN